MSYSQERFPQLNRFGVGELILALIATISIFISVSLKRAMRMVRGSKSLC
jgi:hypothetical protein